jgi:hypothetical protein
MMASAPDQSVGKALLTFGASAMVGTFVFAGVVMVCSTGVGCIVLAGAVSGGAGGLAGYSTDAAITEHEFSADGAAKATAVSGVVGGLTAGIASKFPSRISGFFSRKACSFSGETLVLMADGAKKPIEDIQVGDEVLATDPKTGEQAAKKVEAVFVHDDTVFDLAVEGEVIATTEDHPFWSVTDRRFQRADELAKGEHLLGADGHVITVSGLQLGTARRALAYNLTVEGIHTYHVAEGSILVHNTCWSTVEEKAGDLARYTEGQSTRDPASQWYHELLSDDDLLAAINRAPDGDGIAVSPGGTVVGGHHRWDELLNRVRTGRIAPDTPIRIHIYGGE